MSRERKELDIALARAKNELGFFSSWIFYTKKGKRKNARRLRELPRKIAKLEYKLGTARAQGR